MLPLDELIKKSQSLNNERKYSEVIDLLTDEVLETHHSADLYAEKAQAFYRLDKRNLCNKYFEKALKIEENHAKANHFKGNIYSDSKEYDKAIIAYSKAIKSDPNYIKSYNRLGIAYYNQKQLNKAIETFNKAIIIDPKNLYAYNSLGNIYIDLSDYKKAIEIFKKAIEIDPKYAIPYNGIGNSYFYLSDYDKAIETYNKAIEIAPEIASLYYNQANAYYYFSKYPQALTNYEKYLELTKGTDDFSTTKSQSRITELKKIIGNLDYEKISELVGKIKKLLLFNEKSVTHYTGLLATKALIFEKSKFRLSEGTFLNDTSEGRELFKFLPDLRKNSPSKETIAIPFVQKPFIGSFVSELKHDDLTLWRMYGKENKDEARGCAITLNKGMFLENLKDSLINDGKTEFTEKMDEEFSFYRVAYRKEGQEELFIIPSASIEDQKSLNEYMAELTKEIKLFQSKRRKKLDIQNLIELLSGIAYLFKSAEYQYEHELRLVVEGNIFNKIINSASAQPRVYIELLPICPFITKITLGPKVERAEEWAAAFYYCLDERGYHPEILISHLPFK